MKRSRLKNIPQIAETFPIEQSGIGTQAVQTAGATGLGARPVHHPPSGQPLPTLEHVGAQHFRTPTYTFPDHSFSGCCWSASVAPMWLQPIYTICLLVCITLSPCIIIIHDFLIAQHIMSNIFCFDSDFHHRSSFPLLIKCHILMIALTYSVSSIMRLSEKSGL